MYKDNVINFFSNYKNVLSTIEKLKATAVNDENYILDLYETNIKVLIPTMVEYVKQVLSSISYGSVVDYKTEKEYLEKVSDINKSRIIHHNDLISKVKVCDLICEKLNVNKLFGALDEYSNNVDALLQKNPEDRKDMPKKAFNKRIEIFEWACNVIIFSLTNSKDLELYSDFLNNPQSFINVTDFYNYLSNDEILENIYNKVNR